MIVDAIADGCAAAGFDLCAATTAADYHARVPADVHVEAFGRARALLIVVGNTRALWPRFAAALADPDLAAAADPLDVYAARSIGAVVARVLAGTRHEIYYAPEPPPRRVALQRLADVAGLAALAPSHLCVHPTFGPWIALRAAIAVDVEGPAPAPATPRACDCATGCGAALTRALDAGPPRDGAELRERWRLWLAVRDACPAGRAHRYGDDQIAYHYTGERRYLPRASQSSASAR
jgi:methylmalonic aciduria homocystinuria type C protein